MYTVIVCSVKHRQPIAKVQNVHCWSIVHQSWCSQRWVWYNQSYLRCAFFSWRTLEIAMGLSHLSWNSTHRSKRSSSSSECGYRSAVPHLPSHPDCEHSFDLLLWCKDLELMAREQDRETDRLSIQAEAESQRRQMLRWVPTEPMVPGVRQSWPLLVKCKCPFYFILQ